MTAPQNRGFVEPGHGSGLLDVGRRRYLLSLLVRKEVQVRYRGSVLGWLWSYVKPTFQFLVFFLALGVFLQQNRNMESYPIYLFSGLIVINLFNEAFGNGTRSIVDNGALIKKIYLPREMFPVSSTIVAFVNFLPQLVVTLIVCLLVGWHPEPTQILGLVLGMLIVIVLSTGLGMLFGAANVSFRDSQNFVELIALVATWASPVLYPWTTVRKVLPDWLLQIYLVNPLTTAVELFHAGLWFPTTSETADLPPDLLLKGGLALVIAVIVLLLGQLVFRRLEGRFAQDL
ncbi:ABC transporter permease [Schumannella soli]|uniref:Transport permease protein n=1 Tax=Schumannella soli TaxID=2590779 RepID=A0A506Y9F1_9MICO|nr:ABC transporter permease [Schumannella soli]TPW78120.1 ABC transporter permease [Schumannella soli]